MLTISLYLLFSFLPFLITRCHAEKQSELKEDEGYQCGQNLYSFNYLIQVITYIKDEKFDLTEQYPKIFLQADTKNSLLSEALFLWPLSEGGRKIWEYGEPERDFVVFEFSSLGITDVISQMKPNGRYTKCIKVKPSTFQTSLKSSMRENVFQCGARQIGRHFAENGAKQAKISSRNKHILAKPYVYDLLRRNGVSFGSTPLFTHPVSSSGKSRHDGNLVLIIERKHNEKHLVWVMFKLEDMVKVTDNLIPCKLVAQDNLAPRIESLDLVPLYHEDAFDCGVEKIRVTTALDCAWRAKMRLSKRREKKTFPMLLENGINNFGDPVYIWQLSVRVAENSDNSQTLISQSYYVVLDVYFDVIGMVRQVNQFDSYQECERKAVRIESLTG